MKELEKSWKDKLIAMKYIIKVEHPTTLVPEKKTNISYVSKLNDDFTISCSADINNAYRFDSYEVAWLIAKTKNDGYYNMVDITIMGVSE